MQRREFISGMGVAPGLLAQTGSSVPRPPSSSGALLKPAALKKGDTVALITPSTMVTDPDALATAHRTARYFGWRVKTGKNVGRRFVTFQDFVSARLDDLHAAFADSEVKAVFAIRGGYGAMHLLDRVDYTLIRHNPKIFAGYSDITSLHAAIHSHTGLVTFHSPVLLSAFSEYSQALFRRAMFDAKPLGEVGNPVERNPLRPSHIVRTIRPGKAAGRLVGGNLTLLAGLMGTPHDLDTSGAILFLEDVGEQPYRIDRLLTQMKLGGKLQAAAGLVLGECSDCGPSDYKPSFASPYSLGETLDNLLGDLEIPVFYGLTIGHTSNQATLPLGVAASMDADAGTLHISEAATRPA
jgi:muramoyltetrapeptide carboxypeptidase